MIINGYAPIWLAFPFSLKQLLANKDLSYLHIINISEKLEPTNRYQIHPCIQPCSCLQHINDNVIEGI